MDEYINPNYLFDSRGLSPPNSLMCMLNGVYQRHLAMDAPPSKFFLEVQGIEERMYQLRYEEPNNIHNICLHPHFCRCDWRAILRREYGDYARLSSDTTVEQISYEDWWYWAYTLFMAPIDHRKCRHNENICIWEEDIKEPDVE